MAKTKNEGLSGACQRAAELFSDPTKLVGAALDLPRRFERVAIELGALVRKNGDLATEAVESQRKATKAFFESLVETTRKAGNGELAGVDTWTPAFDAAREQVETGTRLGRKAVTNVVEFLTEAVSVVGEPPAA
jgi:hypothetical protein